MAVCRIGDLPGNPLAASAAFHGQHLPRIIALLSETREPLTLVFAPADHAHRGWRLAAVQSLARARSPRRVNGVAADDEAAIAAAVTYLDDAPGVTGQYWPLDADGAMGA